MTPRMPTSPQEAAQQVMDYMRRKVEQVSAYLGAADVEGANQIMNQVIDETGRGTHDLILDAIARRCGEVSWRIAAETPEWRRD